MAMQTAYLREHEGIVQNSVGQLSSVASAAWRSSIAFGSHQSSVIYGDSSAQIMKPFSLMELPNYLDQSVRGVEQFLDKGNTTHFTIFPDCKMLGDAQKPQATLSLQSSLNRLELGFSHPKICAKYPYMDQVYGLFSAYGPQIPGRIMLPLNLTSDDGPTYVNAKQYRGIIRRRQSRAKAILENKLMKRSKTYMHESRHLHAMRRPRGCGGRFLNTRNSTNGNGKIGSEANNKTGSIGQRFQSSGSQSSEVLQSEVRTLNSSKENNGSSPNISSEVTSMYSRGSLDGFSTIQHVHSLEHMIDGGHDIIMPSKWVAAAGNCCNLNV